MIVKQFLRTHRFLIVVYFLLCITFALVSVIKHARYETAGDIGVFNQIFWQLSHGQWPWISFNLNRPFLSDHFSPILLVLLPFYLLHKDANTLLVIQPFIALLALFPLYTIAFVHTKSTFLSWCIVVAYALYIPLQNALLFEFHDIVFMPTIFTFAYYFLLRNRRKSLFLSLSLLLLVREEAGFFVSAFGLYMMCFEKSFRKTGIFWFFFGAGYSLIIMHFIIPLIGGTYYYFDYGPSGYYPENVFIGIIRNPLLFASYLVNDTVKRDTLIASFSPFVGLPLFSPLGIVVSIEQFASRFFDLRTQTRWTTEFHYSAPLAAVLAIGTSQTLGFIRSLHLPQKKILLYCLGGLLLSIALVNAGRSEVTRYMLNKSWIRESWMDCYDEAVAAVPPGASIATDIEFMPHLSSRKEIHYLFESEKTDYLLITFGSQPNKQPYGIYYYGIKNPSTFKQKIQQDITNGKYKVVFSKCETYVLKKT